MPQPQQLLPNLTFLDLRPPVADAAREVAASLSAARPTLDPVSYTHLTLPTKA